MLPRAEGITLLRVFRPDLPKHDADLQAIAEAVGDLPLVLHLAGSFPAKYRYVLTPAQYHQRLLIAFVETVLVNCDMLDYHVRLRGCPDLHQYTTHDQHDHGWCTGAQVSAEAD